MANKDLFGFDYQRSWPKQEKFPINEDTIGAQVRQILFKDIHNTENLLIITGFTSLSNLVEIFGTTDYPLLKSVKIVIGFDVDERVSKKLVYFSLQKAIKEYWLKEGVSIKLCGPIINIIEKIKNNAIDFKVKKRLHAKIYVTDNNAMIGSSNFSKSGLIYQREANLRVDKEIDKKENYQYHSLKQLAENYIEFSEDYNKDIIELFTKLLKDATWEEALARAIAEILENKWMKDFSVLYQALINKDLWPSQKLGIARAMSIIQDQGNVLLADPTGSGKTKFATTLAFTIFHWLGENGYKERSNALIIAPKQVLENWEYEQTYFNIINKIESMGKLSNNKGKSRERLQKEIEKVDILLIDEAHNFLNWKSQRSLRIRPKRSAHIILSTATPINKKPDDLLRLIELLDIDNLSDTDLKDYRELRKYRNRKVDPSQINKLRGYINQFIVRRTKKDLNHMIEREPLLYINSNGHNCKYPKPISDTYFTGETEQDIEIVKEIHKLLLQLKGINYLQKIVIPNYLISHEEKLQYIEQRFKSAPALAGFMIKSSLRSSRVALYEYLYGTKAACNEFVMESPKNSTGNILETVIKCKRQLPYQELSALLLKEYQWILDKKQYEEACENEINIYKQIGKLCLKLSDQREVTKATTLIEKVNKYRKILAFDSTVLTLDYIKHLLKKLGTDAEIFVATGQNERTKGIVREKFSITNCDKDEKIIALCSDAMSEGINLPSARALILLDMPSVLRIIEQRIGRLERMDSEHKEIYIFWPDDSDEFSLKGDERIVDTLVVTEKLIGNNIGIPKKIYEKHLKRNLSTTNFIQAYEDYSSAEYEWKGVKDSTQSLYSLIEGKEALIDNLTYDMFKDVDATVKSAISFIEDDKEWSFFAFRGDSLKSPKWLFIDENNIACKDFSEITEKLKVYLKNKSIIQRKWSEVNTSEIMSKIVKKLRLKERELLPWKKRRSLKSAEKILNSLLKLSIDSRYETLIKKVLELFNPESSETPIDYDLFSEMWLTILQPARDERRNKQIRKRKIITLEDLKASDVNLDYNILNNIYESCQEATTLDEMVASCIIAVKVKKSELYL